MSERRASPVRSFRTHDVEPDERLEYWENYNTSVLVGLRCATYRMDGLSAEESNVDVGELKLADIRGNAHLVERTPALVRAHPKDSIFASIQLEGSGFFYHADGCFPVRAGDVIIYPTLQPYLFAFGSAMRQVLIDIPGEALRERFGTADVRHPVLVSIRAAGARALADLVDSTHDVGSVFDRCDVASVLQSVALVSGIDKDVSAARVLRARSFIDANISDPSLSAAHVADAIGVTLRHLNRTFAHSGTSVSRLIREQRLDRAVEAIRSSSSTRATVADIAAQWGFSSHAHLTTMIKRRYGVTPSEIRRHPDIEWVPASEPHRD
ncbi:helix-turn-helix domain-containing protein [Mycolicibacterium sp. CBM1]